MMKLVILDRDGVINKELKWVENPDEFEFIDGAIEAIANFKKAGYITAIATNQSHIDRGRFTVADLDAIHDKMLKELRANGGDIDKIVYCPSFDNMIRLFIARALIITILVVNQIRECY